MHGSPIASNPGRAAPVSADAAGHHSGSWRPGSAGVWLSRPWFSRASHIDHPYGEEEIALLEEELLPAMAVFLARVDAIDRAIEADQELEFKAHQAR